MTRVERGGVAGTPQEAQLMMSAAEYAVRVVELRSELRDAIQTLSNARRAEVWEIVNKLIAVERLDASR